MWKKLSGKSRKEMKMPYVVDDHGNRRHFREITRPWMERDGKEYILYRPMKSHNYEIVRATPKNIEALKYVSKSRKYKPQGYKGNAGFRRK
jgi:uncharacterized protein YrzB (UPF0473 family)